MKTFSKNILLAGLATAAIVLGSIQVNALGFRHDMAGNHGKMLTEAKFYDAVSNTKTNMVSMVFGYPDQILSLKKPNGELQGVVWVYRNAVKKDDGSLADARLVLIEGELQYVALSKAV